MLDSSHDGIIVIGKRKKGKSTLTRQLFGNERRVIIYDAKGATSLVQPTHVSMGNIPANVVFAPKREILRVSVARGKEPWKELEFSAYLAIMAKHVVWVCDEFADALEGREPGECVSHVIRMGREQDVRFILTFQRPAEVPRMATGMASDWYIFQSNEPNDMEFVKRSVSAEAASIMKSLPVGQAVHVKDGSVVGIMHSEGGAWLHSK